MNDEEKYRAIFKIDPEKKSLIKSNGILIEDNEYIPNNLKEKYKKIDIFRDMRFIENKEGKIVYAESEITLIPKMKINTEEELMDLIYIAYSASFVLFSERRREEIERIDIIIPEEFAGEKIQDHISKWNQEEYEKKANKLISHMKNRISKMRKYRDSLNSQLHRTKYKVFAKPFPLYFMGIYILSVSLKEIGLPYDPLKLSIYSIPIGLFILGSLVENIEIEKEREIEGKLWNIEKKIKDYSKVEELMYITERIDNLKYHIGSIKIEIYKEL